MQTLAIIILLALCTALLLRLVRVERNLRGAARQLRDVQTSHSAVHLRMEASNAASEELLRAINELLDAREAETFRYRAQERTIRQQIANVSHDLRTPLTSILGYLQLLEGDALTPDERREYLAIVQGRAKSLQALITGFYDLSRIEGGEYPLACQPVDLAAVLSRLAAEFYNDFTDRGFQVEVALEKGLPPVMADPGGVARIFTNLIQNALSHGEKSLSIRLLLRGNAVVSSFSNDATTLSEEDTAHVFERFYTADKMRSGQSTGLGLAIVKGLTERMGHTVSAEMSDGLFTISVQWNL